MRADALLLAAFLVRPFIHPQYAQLGPKPFSPDLSTVPDASSFLTAIQLLPNPPAPALNKKTFRQLCRSTSAGFSSPTIPHSAWLSFWKFPLSHSTRNVWYRILHRKLPCRAFLHSIMPEVFSFPSCITCGQSEETIEHFLYQCPLKLTVWQHIWEEHFSVHFRL